MNMSPAARIIGKTVVFLLSAAGAYLSGFACADGAVLMGLREGGWNLQFLPFLLGGWIFGSVVGLVIAIIGLFKFSARPATILFLSFFAPIVLSAIAGALAFPLLEYFSHP